MAATITANSIQNWLNAFDDLRPVGSTKFLHEFPSK